eukprot:6377960-Amphidinium_carterae.1
MSASKLEVQLNAVRFLPRRSMARTHRAHPQVLSDVTPCFVGRRRRHERALVGTHKGTSCADACL